MAEEKVDGRSTRGRNTRLMNESKITAALLDAAKNLKPLTFDAVSAATGLSHMTVRKYAGTSDGLARLACRALVEDCCKEAREASGTGQDAVVEALSRFCFITASLSGSWAALLTTAASPVEPGQGALLEKVVADAFEIRGPDLSKVVEKAVAQTVFEVGTTKPSLGRIKESLREFASEPV